MTQPVLCPLCPLSLGLDICDSNFLPCLDLMAFPVKVCQPSKNELLFSSVKSGIWYLRIVPFSCDALRNLGSAFNFLVQC